MRRKIKRGTKHAALLVLWLLVIALAACQGKSPTAPGEEKTTAGSASGASASGIRPYDDDDDRPPAGSTLSVKLTANPKTIQPGQSSTLTWTSTGATSVELNDEHVPLNGSKIVTPSVTKEYDIEARDGTYKVESEVTIVVSTTAPPPSAMPTANLTASPMSIQSGQSSMLTWTTSNATQVMLDGAVVAANGSRSMSPTATKMYSLVATNSAGSTTDTVTVTVTAPPPPPPPPTPKPTATLSANPASIQSGQSSMLSWTTADATSVTLNGAAVSANGSQSVSPTADTTYSLVATNSGGSTTATATVTVTAPPPPPPPPTPKPTATLTANPASIQTGQSSMLSWTTTDATSVTLNGASVATSGSQSVSPGATATYSLVATNSAGSTTATATVTVTVPMPTASISANPASIQTGQSSMLSWTTANATTVTLNGASVAASGSQSVSPTSTATYTLMATNSAGSRTATATVTVTAPPPPMPTAMLNANPTSIQAGQSSTLSWTTSNAASVTLNGSGVAANGSQMVSPGSTTTYSLVATNATGSVTSTATVTVVAMPQITYVKDIAPIMQQNCVMCHSGPQPTAGRDFTTYQGVMTVVTPFDGNSRLIQMTKPGAPMHGFLSPDPAARAEIIRRWIVDFGAPQQ